MSKPRWTREATDSPPPVLYFPPMGLTTVSVELYDPRVDGPGHPCELLVDSGAVYSVVPESVLRAMGITPTRTMRFSLADGQVIERAVGEVGLRFGGAQATSPVVFGETEDVFLFGAVTLETLALVLDPFKRELRPARLMLV